MNFTIHPYVETYLNQKSQLIDEEDFEKLYENFPNPKRFSTEIANMTAALYLAGIDPLESSNKVFSCMFYSFPSGILPSSYKIPPQIERIEDWAFKFSMFEEIIFPQALTEIHESAFRGMNKLKTVEFGPNLRSISRHPLYGCENLKEIIIPKASFDRVRGKVKELTAGNNAKVIIV